MSCILVPSYLFEISPYGLRDKIGNLHTQSLAFGILVSQILGFSQILGTADLWHLLLAIPIIPAILGSILLLVVLPDSPAVLIENRDEEKARKVLKKLRGLTNVNGEVQLLCKEIADAEESDKIRFQDLVDNKNFHWPVICAVLLQIAQQFCGIQVVRKTFSILILNNNASGFFLRCSFIREYFLKLLAFLLAIFNMRLF